MPAVAWAAGCTSDMGPLRELLATSRRQALEFFVQRLKDVSGPSVDQQELLYNASVLAHYTQVSTHARLEAPAPAHLGVVFDQFVVDTTLAHDGPMLETAGAQCLVLTGFFEDQMRRRHSISWYAQLGAAFFRRAAAQDPEPRRAQLFDTLSRRFEAWRRRQAQLARDLRDQPFLLIRHNDATSL
ncbi:MAG: hypothetical protein AB7F99_13025 [Vicinamibacterales bacterium]